MLLNQVKYSILLLVGLPVWTMAGPSSVKTELPTARPAQTKVEPLKLTLQDAIQIALANNPDLLKAKAEIERLSGVTYEVRAAALPRVTGNYSFTQTDEYLLGESSSFAGGGSSSSATSAGGFAASPVLEPNTDQPTSEQWSVGVTVSKTLFDAGATRASIENAKLGEQAGILQLQEVVLDVLFNVRSTFYGVLLNRARIGVEQENLNLLEAQLKRQKQLFDAGTTAKFSVLRAEVAANNARPDLIAARNQYRNSLTALARLLAIDYPQNAGIDESPILPVGELTSDNRTLQVEPLVAQALQIRPTIKSSEIGVSRQLASIRVARAGYFPTLEAYGTYSYDHETFADNLKENDGGYVAGVRGSWNLFDGLATKGRMDQARASLKSAEVERGDVRRGVEQDVREAYSNFVQAQELVVSQQGSTDLAAESLRLSESRLDAGVGTQIDVLDAQTELNSARVNELNARYQFQLALAELARAVGLQGMPSSHSVVQP